MIYFVSCNKDRNILLGEDSRLYPILYNDENTVLFNFMGYYSIGRQLPFLTPPPEIWYGDEMGYITNYPKVLQSHEAWLDIMRIMMADYYGKRVVIVTDLDSDQVASSVDIILDYIYKRYNYMPKIISTLDDLLEPVEDSLNDPFGSQVFLMDKEAFVKETVDMNDLEKNMEGMYDINTRMI